jgi:hypothetical protein
MGVSFSFPHGLAHRVMCPSWEAKDGSQMEVPLGSGKDGCSALRPPGRGRWGSSTAARGQSARGRLWPSEPLGIRCGNPLDRHESRSVIQRCPSSFRTLGPVSFARPHGADLCANVVFGHRARTAG